MAGIDSNALLVLHLNSDFSDSSEYSRTPTGAGTAQIDTGTKKFGAGSLLLDGNSDYVSFPDSADWDFGTDDMTIDFWVNFNSTSGSQCFIGRPTSGSSYFYFALEGGGIRCRDYNGGFDANFGNVYTFSTGTWYHLAIVRTGTHWMFFIDGVQKGSTITTQTGAFIERSTTLQVGANSAIGYYVNGYMDEVRISNVARWTSNFTPPSSEYTDGNVTVSASALSITSSVPSNTFQISPTISVNPLSIVASIPDGLYGNIVIVTPTALTITSSIPATTESADVTVEPSVLTISSSLNAPIFPVYGSLIGKIIHTNPLIAVTDTSPAKIIKIDISNPASLVYEAVTIVGVNNAEDVVVDSSGSYVYVAGGAGKVVKIKISDLTDQTITDLSDTDNLLTIEHNTNYGVTYTGTNNTTGELYLLDDRETFSIDAEFTCLNYNTFNLDTHFQIVDAFNMDSAFTCLSYTYYKMSCDFKCLTKESVAITSIDDIVPIDLADYKVYIDAVELANTDLILDSISITHSIDEESQATFRLTRQHDNLNTTLEGVSSTITNQNAVVITIDGVTEFSGKVSELQCVYENDSEYIIVNALATEKTSLYNTITMSLPGQASRLSLYDVLINNPRIYNPYVDPTNEDNPKKYKGIRVNLGTKIEEHVQSFYRFDANGNVADEIQGGTFNPEQNWTYFWSPTVNKIDTGVVVNGQDTTLAEDNANKVDEDHRALPVTRRKIRLQLGTKIRTILTNISNGIQSTMDTISKNINDLAPLSAIRFMYIGTSLAPVSEDLWDLKQAAHWKQAIGDETETGYIPSFTTGAGSLTRTVAQADNWATQSFTRGWDADNKTLKAWGGTPDPNTDYVPVDYISYYTIGSAPFKDVSIRNGMKVTKPRLEDEGDGLYSVKGESYDYRKYCKLVADLEYEKLKNINGDVLPETSCDLSMTIDAYLYYKISLLTRINIDNTTSANIYNGGNGFPVSVKSITITSSNRKVSLNADNLKSTPELEVINSSYPDENDSEFYTPETSTLVAVKSDMRTRLAVEKAVIERDKALESGL